MLNKNNNSDSEKKIALTAENLAEQLIGLSDKMDRESKLTQALEVFPHSKPLYQSNLEIINGQEYSSTSVEFLMQLENILLEKAKQVIERSKNIDENSIKHTSRKLQKEQIDAAIDNLEKLFHKNSNDATKLTLGDTTIKAFGNDFFNIIESINIAREHRKKLQNANSKDDVSQNRLKNTGLNILTSFAVVGLLPLLLLRAAINFIANLAKQQQQVDNDIDKSK